MRRGESKHEKTDVREPEGVWEQEVSGGGRRWVREVGERGDMLELRRGP